MKKQYAIAGIGTDVGKTVVSAILVEALKGTYIKPVQAGDLANSDTIKVRKWCSDEVTVLEECIRLNHPMSPHAAAELEGRTVSLNDINLPEIAGNFIVEGAGGVLVPLNYKQETMLDVYQKVNLPVIIVSRHYLGSINHTLLTISELKRAGIVIEGLIYVGEENEGTEKIITLNTGVKTIARIPITDNVNNLFIQEQAKLMRKKL